jgi:hypothetical protein
MQGNIVLQSKWKQHLNFPYRFAYSQPPTLTMPALQKLIDKRNIACKEALDKFVHVLSSAYLRILSLFPVLLYRHRWVRTPFSCFKTLGELSFPWIRHTLRTRKQDPVN